MFMTIFVTQWKSDISKFCVCIDKCKDEISSKLYSVCVYYLVLQHLQRIEITQNNMYPRKCLNVYGKLTFVELM